MSDEKSNKNVSAREARIVFLPSVKKQIKKKSFNVDNEMTRGKLWDQFWWFPFLFFFLALSWALFKTKSSLHQMGHRVPFSSSLLLLNEHTHTHIHIVPTYNAHSKIYSPFMCHNLMLSLRYMAHLVDQINTRNEIMCPSESPKLW